MKSGGEEGTGGTAALIDLSWQQPVSRYHFCLIHEPSHRWRDFHWNMLEAALEERVSGRSSDLGKREREDADGAEQAALLSSFSPSWCAPASVEPFLNTTSDFPFLLLSLPCTHTLNCLRLICCCCVWAGLADSWDDGCRFHPRVLRSGWCHMWDETGNNGSESHTL